MKKLSIQKLSILGLVLMAASAVTAAVLPAQNKTNVLESINGSLTVSSEGNLQSCTPTDGEFTVACHDTTSVGPDALSGSTGGLQTSQGTTLNEILG